MFISRIFATQPNPASPPRSTPMDSGVHPEAHVGQHLHLPPPIPAPFRLPLPLPPSLPLRPPQPQLMPLWLHDAAPERTADAQTRHQRMIGMTLENLLATLRRSSAADARAVAIDLKRVTRAAGQLPSDLLNAAPNRSDIIDQLAFTRHAVALKLQILVRLGFDPTQVNARGENLLHAGARHNNVPLVLALGPDATKLLAMRTARAGDCTEANPLAVAIAMKHPAYVAALLAVGASLTEPCCTDVNQVELQAWATHALQESHDRDMAVALRMTRPHRQALIE